MSPETGGETATNPEQLGDRGPRIYVASLSDYNDGCLHGTWIDADQDPESIGEDIGEMLTKSRCYPAEEYAIHDYEGFGPMPVGEYDSLEDVARLGQGIVEHGLAFAVFAADLDRTEWSKLDDFEDHYRGQWNSTEDFAEELLGDMGVDLDSIGPEILQPYIRVDLEAFGRDLAYDLMICDDTAGGVYVFDRE